MPSLRKLKVVVQERYQEPVLLHLCKEGDIQFTKVDCEEESNAGFLQACPVADDNVAKNSEIQTRIKSKLDELDLELEDKSDTVELLPGNMIYEIISK